MGKRITGSSFDGVIVAASGKSGKGESAVELWTPSEQDVTTLEKGMPAYVAAELRRWKTTLPRQLKEYKRQYVGFVEHGRHEIVAQLFHQSTDLVKSGKWLRMMVSVAGGGDDYLRVRYNADTKKFLWFGVNAPE